MLKALCAMVPVVALTLVSWIQQVPQPAVSTVQITTPSDDDVARADVIVLQMELCVEYNTTLVERLDAQFEADFGPDIYWYVGEDFVPTVTKISYIGDPSEMLAKDRAMDSQAFCFANPGAEAIRSKYESLRAQRVGTEF